MAHFILLVMNNVLSNAWFMLINAFYTLFKNIFVVHSLIAPSVVGSFYFVIDRLFDSLNPISDRNAHISPKQVLNSKIASEYDQEIPQSQTADNPMAPRGRAPQPSRDSRKTNKASTSSLFPIKMIAIFHKADVHQ